MLSFVFVRQVPKENPSIVQLLSLSQFCLHLYRAQGLISVKTERGTGRTQRCLNEFKKLENWSVTRKDLNKERSLTELTLCVTFGYS